MDYLTLGIGVVFLIVGYMYLYKKRIILYINAFLRENVFNDMHVLTQNRKIGVFFLLLAFIFLYFGYIKVTPPH